MLGRRALLATVAATPIAVALPAEAAHRGRHWPGGAVLDQHKLPACEAFAFVGAYMCGPGRHLTTKQGNRLARYIHNRANEMDPVDPGDGAAAWHVLEVGKQLGMVRSWEWLQTVDDIVDAIAHRGPVPLGVRMTRRLAATRRREIVRPHVGFWESHAMVATAYLPRDKRAGRGPSIELRNSWGRDWGVGGSAWITVADLRSMFGPRPHVGHYTDAYLPTWGSTTAGRL